MSLGAEIAPVRESATASASRGNGHPCRCRREHQPRLVVVTGGPGAGKTAALELARRQFCEHVVILPEAASIVFGGGFPRMSSRDARRCAQRAIFHVQRELENLALTGPRPALVLCDRGTVDGQAYWPGDRAQLFAELRTTRESELARYAAVIHLRTPTLRDGYDHANPLRIETAREAHAIDERIAEAWSGHPRRVAVSASHDFMAKVTRAIAAINAEAPSCCSELTDEATIHSSRQA